MKGTASYRGLRYYVATFGLQVMTYGTLAALFIPMLRSWWLAVPWIALAVYTLWRAFNPESNEDYLKRRMHQFNERDSWDLDSGEKRRRAREEVFHSERLSNRAKYGHEAQAKDTQEGRVTWYGRPDDR